MASSFVKGDKPGTHCLRRKASEQPQKKARREVRTTAENVISVEASPAPQSEFNPVRRAASPLQKLHDEILAFRDVVAPSSTERAAREDAFRTLERAAKRAGRIARQKSSGARSRSSSCRRRTWTSWSSARRWTRAPAASRSGCGRWRRRSRTWARSRRVIRVLFVRPRRVRSWGPRPSGSRRRRWGRVRGCAIDAAPAWSQVPRGRRVPRASPSSSTSTRPQIRPSTSLLTWKVAYERASSSGATWTRCRRYDL